MRQRCNNPNDHAYRYYGGQGVKVGDRWELKRGGSFVKFFAHVGHAPPGKSLDRIDPNGNYEPGNVRWATALEQARNKRHHRNTYRDPDDDGENYAHDDDGGSFA
jgi:hypothetical protein